MRYRLLFFNSFLLLCLLGLPLLSSVEAAPSKVENKLQFQYLALPGTVVESTVGSIQMVMMNNGAAGEVVYDGSDTDQVLVSVPVGDGADDLIAHGDGASCSTSSSLWDCEIISTSASGIRLAFYPVGGVVPVAKGETLYFYLNNIQVNEAAGQATLEVDQQIAPFRAAKAVNTQMSLIKVTESAALFLENDPTVLASVKDGVDWSELGGIPAGFADGKDDGLISESDPTVLASVKDGVDWTEVGEIPAGFADGKDDGLISESDPTVLASVKDGVDWTELGGIPAGFADGKDDGLISESDPTVLASVKDGVDWTELGEIPAGFADGKDDGLTSESDPTVPASLKDGVDWTEISGIPAGIVDGDQVGLTSESDPKVGSNNLNRISKWDGKALVGSKSINENNAGNVGIGTATPAAKLHVQGNIIADGPTEKNHVATKEYVDSVKGASGNPWQLVWQGSPRGQGGNIVNEWGTGEYLFLYGQTESRAKFMAYMILPTLDMPDYYQAISSEGSQIVFYKVQKDANNRSLFMFTLANNNNKLYSVWRKGF